MFIKLRRWFKKSKNQRPIKRDKNFDGPIIIYFEGLTGRKHSGYFVDGTQLSQKEFEMFQYLWNNTSIKRTEKLVEIFIRLAKAK